MISPKSSIRQKQQDTKANAAAFDTAEQLISGKLTVSELKKQELNKVYSSLIALRDEESFLNKDTKRIRNIQRLINQISEVTSNNIPSPRTPQKKQPNSPSIIEISDEEYESLSKIVDQMLDGNDKQIDDITKKQKLIHVVKERKNEAIDTYDYDLVEKCDNLIDNLRKTVKTPDNSKKQHFLKLHQRYKEAIGQLVSLEKEKQEHFEELEKQKEEQSNSLAQQYEDELRIFNESVPNFDASNFKSSKELIEKRIDERNYALGREYEAAKKMHHIIEELEEKEKKNALYEFRKSISKQREKLGKTYEIKKEGLNSRWETLMSKETKKWDEILLVQRKKIEFLENELEDAKRKYEKQKKLDKIP